MDEKKGFFAALLDVSFSEFVTTRVVRVLYVLAIIMAALVTLTTIAKGITTGFGPALGSLIVGPLLGLLYLLVARIWLEVVLVLFRIGENTKALVEHKTGGKAAE